jgi:cellulase/cellobiase CelA1
LLARLKDGSAGGRGSNPACSEGIDNDGDGLTDFPNDPGCSSASDDDETGDQTGGGDSLGVSVKINDDWGAGYCGQVTVTNNGSQVSDLKVAFTIDGTIRDLLDATYTQTVDSVAAEGASWNNTVIRASRSISDSVPIE